MTLPTPPVDPARRAVDIGMLADRLRSVFADPRYRPPMPPTVAMKLLELSQRGEVDPGEVAVLFSQDPLLATHVMRIARSPLYGGVAVPTVRDAVIRLGTRRMQRIVFEAALDMRVFRSAVYGPWMDRIRRHSVAVGHVAAHLAQTYSVNVDQAFIAGLVHDVGSAAILAAVGERSTEFADVDSSALTEGLAAVHIEAGALIAKTWDLKGDTRLVISGHHNVTVTHHPLLAVVVVAEAMALEAGFDVTSGGLVLDPLVASDLEQAHRTLHIDVERAAELSREMAPLFELLGTVSA